MKNEIRTYKVKLRVITPLFVGSGKVINRSQYINFRDKRVVRMINAQKLVGFLSEHRVLNEY
jgi:CRISPR/Cas system CSM-associated protein Csm5 (group 7 of RAMP superfamily)